MSTIRVVSFAMMALALLAMPLTSFATFSGVSICIDPGHGGSDPGAGGYGLNESDINLDIALRAQSLLEQDGATVVMTRADDSYVSLQGRCDIANNAGVDRFIASHCNAFNGNAYGTETYCYALGGIEENHAANVNAQLVSALGTTDRGVKTAGFYVLLHTSMCAILSEVAFIDNYDDNAKLADPNYRQAAARAYLYGTQAHYGMTPHDPASEVIVDNTSAYYSSSGYWQTRTTSADKYGSDYQFSSTRSFTDLATFAPPLANCNYAIYAWWTQGSNRSDNAPYVIRYNGGQDTIGVNQQTGGGQWNYLGTWSFTNGNSVSLDSQTGLGYVVIADAIKFVPQ